MLKSALGLSLILSALPAKALTLDIGIVQRFGENPSPLVIQAVGKAPLTLTLDRKTAITARQVTLTPLTLPLTPPLPWSRVVVSSHRSYEDAQAIAQNLGFPAEIARPQRWQVWAERQYSSPTPQQEQLVTRLKERGYSTARLDSGLQTNQIMLDLTRQNQHYTAQQIQIQGANQQFQVGTRRYSGSLNIRPNAYGTYSLINRVELETYLRGVVPYEIASIAPYEAIQAQAVVARTFALKNRQRFALDGYDLCATANCQVYRGLGGATALTDRAVARTKGQVLTFGNNFVDALYTAANGGVTARYSDLWGGVDRPYLIARPDRLTQAIAATSPNLGQEQAVRDLLNQTTGFNETGAPAFHWRRSYSSRELAASLNENLPTIGVQMAPITAVTALKISNRSTSGRVLTLEIQTDQGTITLQKDAILSAINNLPSTLFYLAATKAGSFQLVGGGWGHGIGLSQYGSYGLARRGLAYREILNFYFPGTQLQQLN